MGIGAIDSLYDILNQNMVICSWNDAQVFLVDAVNELQPLSLSDNEFHIDLEIPSEVYKQILLHGEYIKDGNEEAYRSTTIEFVRKNKAKLEVPSFRIEYNHELSSIS